MQKRTYRISSDDIDYLKHSLQSYGCYVIQTEQESDPVLGHLCRDEDYVASNDSDIFLYGKPNLIFDLSSSGKEFRSLWFDSILKALKIT